MSLFEQCIRSGSISNGISFGPYQVFMSKRMRSSLSHSLTLQSLSEKIVHSLLENSFGMALLVKGIKRLSYIISSPLGCAGCGSNAVPVRVFPVPLGMAA